MRVNCSAAENHQGPIVRLPEVIARDFVYEYAKNDWYHMSSYLSQRYRTI